MFSNFRIVEVPLNQIDEYLKRIQTDPSFKGVFGRSSMRILYRNQNARRESRLKICKDPLMTIPIVVYTRPDFFLLKILNEKLQVIQSSGLVKFWMRQHIDDDLLKFIEPREPKVLSLSDLFGSFQILFLGSALGLFVLILENVLKKIRYQ